MNLPQVYMCSPFQTLLPPHTIPLGRPSAPAPSMTQRDGTGMEVGGGSGWGTRVYLWRIHVDIWQSQYNIVKLKNKKINKTNPN